MTETPEHPVQTSTLTCPQCGHVATETLPTDACWFFYECRGCATLLRPLPGDCCVFCSYDSMPCPPLQAARESGGGERCRRASVSGRPPGFAGEAVIV
jgi:hypothetical protein